jgi:hypothetical protein
VHHHDPLHPERGLVSQQPLAHWLARSTIPLPPARRRVAECGLALVSPPGG